MCAQRTFGLGSSLHAPRQNGTIKTKGCRGGGDEENESIGGGAERQETERKILESTLYIDFT